MFSVSFIWLPPCIAADCLITPADEWRAPRQTTVDPHIFSIPEVKFAYFTLCVLAEQVAALQVEH